MPSQSKPAQEDAEMPLNAMKMRKVPMELKPWFENYDRDSTYPEQPWRVPDAAISTALTLALAGEVYLRMDGLQLPPVDCGHAQGRRRAGFNVQDHSEDPHLRHQPAAVRHRPP